MGLDPFSPSTLGPFGPSNWISELVATGEAADRRGRALHLSRPAGRGCHRQEERHEAGGRPKWLWVETNGIPFWLVGEFTTHCRTYLSGWIGMFTWGTIWVLTHGQMGEIKLGRPKKPRTGHFLGASLWRKLRRCPFRETPKTLRTPINKWAGFPLGLLKLT